MHEIGDFLYITPHLDLRRIVIAHAGSELYILAFDHEYLGGYCRLFLRRSEGYSKIPLDML